MTFLIPPSVFHSSVLTTTAFPFMVYVKQKTIVYLLLFFTYTSTTDYFLCIQVAPPTLANVYIKLKENKINHVFRKITIIIMPFSI